MKDEVGRMKDEGWGRKNERLPITAGASLPNGSKQYFKPLFIKDPSATF